jgi:membrane protease YdiL (CAAX protease family)
MKFIHSKESLNQIWNRSDILKNSILEISVICLTLSFFLFSIQGSFTKWLFPLVVLIQFLVLFCIILYQKGFLARNNIDGFSLILLVVFNPSNLYLNFYGFYIINVFAIGLLVWWIKNNKALFCTFNSKQVLLFVVGFCIGLFLVLIKITIIKGDLIFVLFQNPARLIVCAYSAITQGAILEEFIFRGLLFGILRKKNVNEKWIILISSVLWGFTHLVVGNGIANIIDAIFSGIIFGILVSKYKSLSIGIGAHVGYNVLVAMFSVFL